jgi:hypothetical protein
VLHPAGDVVMPAAVMRRAPSWTAPARYVEAGADTQDVMNQWLGESRANEHRR